jgi:predicted ribosome quality control (RQC) complex YloA/Tae2 family protein
MKEFVNSNGIRFYIGQNAKENEEITYNFKAINRDDILWFHIDDHPGPHIILVPGEYPVQKSDIQEGANYAVSYSKVSSVAHKVSYCSISDIVKTRDTLELGSFVMKKSKTIKGYRLASTKN